MKRPFYYALALVLGMACTVKKRPEVPALFIVPIPSPSGPNGSDPYLFSDQDSTVYLSWMEQGGDTATLKLSRLQGGLWSQPITIASGTGWFVNWADYPTIAVNRKNFAAHFLEKRGQSKFAYDIRIALSADHGNSWSTPWVLNDDRKEAEHGFVSLVPYKKGFFVSWLDGRNMMTMTEGMDHHEHDQGPMSLRAAVIDSLGTKTMEWELDGKTCDCCQTSAAITVNGPVVVYRDRSDDEVRDISIIRFVNGQWTVPVTIREDRWMIKGCPVNGPRITSYGNTLAVAWFSAAADRPQVNVLFSKDGGATFGKTVRVDEGNTIGRVDVEFVNGKSVMVSWMDGELIKAAILHTDETREESMVIAKSSDARSSGFPQIALSGNRVIFAWTDEKAMTIKTAGLTLRGN